MRNEIAITVTKASDGWLERGPGVVFLCRTWAKMLVPDLEVGTNGLARIVLSAAPREGSTLIEKTGGSNIFIKLHIPKLKKEDNLFGWKRLIIEAYFRTNSSFYLGWESPAATEKVVEISDNFINARRIVQNVKNGWRTTDAIILGAKRTISNESSRRARGYSHPKAVPLR